MDINFKNIRTHNGSQNSGFEELVCQLAHLRKPENGSKFVRKEGAGGDAGVECYWTLTDESEICWQAKFFLGEMNSSRWQQLNKSFTTALEKHPNLKKYVVCLPLDKSDSRKKGRGGEHVVSIETEWKDHISKWKKMVKEQERSIEFEYWGKHEITLFLTIDDPSYSGRALYWFNEPVLGFETFKKIAHRSRENLGDRYTPEFHVDLPIAKSFNGLCLNDQWWEELEEKTESLNSKKDRFFRKFAENKSNLLNTKKNEELKDKYSEVYRILTDGLDQKDLMSKIQNVQELLLKISECCYELNEEKILDDQEYQDERSLFYSFFNELTIFSNFLETREVKAARIKAAFLYGEAGIGKSHLLCDTSLHRIENNLPTVFLLGSQYRGGNPTELIKDALDLKQHRDGQVLGAIDAAGEASGSRILIIIDAINEGLNRDDWRNNIKSFLSQLSEFNNIAILLSCRSTYLKYMLPDSINEECLVQIEHFGFRGYENRATEKYLSKQGISKPSTPMLAPEFTNPLFLKTCCQALKASEQTSFPKGLRGITSLFNFYIQSVEKTVARNKRYTPEEKIIKDSLLEFSSELFPDHLIGIPKEKARLLFNERDPNPNKGDSLFDELLNEGVLSEDISYESQGQGKPVIRFTYERFSDYFIAQQIAEKYDSGTIDDIFSADQPLGKIISEDRYYENAGIFEALEIIIAEKHNKELVDLISKDADIDEWWIAETFSNAVIWRTPGSFSDKTLELLNQQPMEFVINVLLKLATEPEHPWNAELIHENLIDKEIADRDHFWSIHIASSGDSSKTYEEETIVTTLIEWSCFGDIEEVGEERIRLCAITLLWFLTTPNREVRDKSTKSLVRILSRYPSLLPDLLHKFHSVNDPYLVERLYATAYGVVCNIKDPSIVSHIANIVFELVFKEGKPPPHILLRDYAWGIMELALHKKLLPNEINVELFRLPYRSEWPLENPTGKEIDSLVGEEKYSKIKDSLMGFPGDFGNYTMSYVHRWSSTPLSESAPETGYDIKKKFAEKYLHGEIKAEYLKKLDPIQQSKSDFKAKFLDEKLIDQKRKEEEIWEERIKAQINDESKEYYRWLSRLDDNRPAAFSRKWAQRWVCKHAYELGWTEDLFSEFEENWCSYSRGAGSKNVAMERVGKKYQWIALHKFLAHLSDNIHWINRDEDKSYCGPWQIYGRDIDPTIWIRKNGEYSSYYNKVSTWWQPYKFPFLAIKGTPEKTKYLWDKTQLPNFSELLQLKDPETQNRWTVLRGFWSEEQEKRDRKNDPTLNAWFRINTIFVPKKDCAVVEEKLRNKPLIDPFIVSISSTEHQRYLGEYPWHPAYGFMSGWKNPEDDFRGLIPTKYFVPVSQYEWETGNQDHSIDKSLSFYLPAKELVESLELRRVNNDFGSWRDDDGVIFRDPSIEKYGPSYALMDSRKLNEWLNENELDILWLIGGEKTLFLSYPHKFYGSLIYSGLFKLVGSIPSGSLWFGRQEPTSN